jgi:hypothetical protein
MCLIDTDPTTSVPLTLYLVVDLEASLALPLGEVVEAFVGREHALCFIEMAHEHGHPRAHSLRIEELEATRVAPIPNRA